MKRKRKTLDERRVADRTAKKLARQAARVEDGTCLEDGTCSRCWSGSGKKSGHLGRHMKHKRPASTIKCKKCSKNAMPANYGFCDEHRARPDHDEGKTAPRSGHMKHKRPAGKCKKCSKNAMPANYGFCDEHRARPDHDEGKTAPRSGRTDFTCCKRNDSVKENSRRQQFSPTSKQDKDLLHTFNALAKRRGIALLDTANAGCVGTMSHHYKVLQAFGPFITPSWRR